MNYLNLFISFLGGGAFTAWFTWFLSQRSQRKADERTMLSEQLRLLYGPVAFYVSQNRVLFQLSEQIVKAAECDELNPVGPDGKKSSAVSFDEFKETINISNDYVAEVDGNNERILKLFNDHWSHVDPRDAELFMRMVADYLRFRIEKDAEGKWKASFLICMQTNKISFMLPEFANRVDERTRELQTRIGLAGRGGMSC